MHITQRAKGVVVVRNFPERLRRLRLEREWQQKDLAEISGIHRSQLSAYEIGRYRPSWEALIQLAEAIDCTVDYLMQGRESDSPPRAAEPVTLYVNGS